MCAIARHLTFAWAPGMLPEAEASVEVKWRVAVSSTKDVIAFIHKINKDRDLQVRVNALKPRDWSGFFALAAEMGYDLDLETFHNGCLSEKVVYFCPTLVQFAGQLFLYKM